MQAERRKAEDVLSFDFRGHLHTSVTFMRPYAPYAPLLGVGPFFALFLLREVHTAAYGCRWNQALTLLPVGIGASSARRNQSAYGSAYGFRPILAEIARRGNRFAHACHHHRPTRRVPLAPVRRSLAPLTGFRPFGG